MKKKKSLIALLLLGGALCAGAFALGGCSDDGSTNIPEEEPPLGPAVCTHVNVSHTNAKAPECTVNGNKEYWFCDDCDKYFSDEGLTTETTLAAVTLNSNGHSYGKWIDEEAKSCNKDGVKGHYHCEPCGKNFDKDKKELASLVIEKGHEYGTLIEEEPAGTCTDGKKAHYHCDACGTDFNDQKQEFDGLPEGIGTGSLIIKAQHNLVLVPVKEATCEEDGVQTEHRHCQDCGKNFDPVSMNEIDVITEEHGHKYPEEYTYDYTEKVYKKVCERDNAHVLTQAAGTEAYPYLVDNITTFNEAIALGGYIKLEKDISSNKTIKIENVDTVNIDLNGYTLFGSNTRVLSIYTTAKNVSIKNGTVKSIMNQPGKTYAAYGIQTNWANASEEQHTVLNMDNVTVDVSAAVSTDIREGANAAKYAPFAVQLNDYTEATLNNCTLKAGNYYGSAGINVYKEVNLTMNNCEITSEGYSISNNGSKTDGVNPVITLNNVTAKSTGAHAVYLPAIGGVTTINGGSFEGATTGVEIRGGSLTIDGTTEYGEVEITGNMDPAQFAANSNGSTVGGAALAVSQHTHNAAISVIVKGAKLHGVYALFEKDLQGHVEGEGEISITLGDGNTIEGLIYSENCDNIVDTGDDNGKALEGQAA